MPLQTPALCPPASDGGSLCGFLLFGRHIGSRLSWSNATRCLSRCKHACEGLMSSMRSESIRSRDEMTRPGQAWMMLTRRCRESGSEWRMVGLRITSMDVAGRRRREVARWTRDGKPRTCKRLGAVDSKWLVALGYLPGGVTLREVIGKVCRIRFHCGCARDTPILILRCACSRRAGCRRQPFFGAGRMKNFVQR